MINRENIFYWLTGAGVVWLFARSRKPSTVESVFNITGNLLAQLENFSAHPYWDISRYSWGYGTAAPGATGTISEPQARADMLEHVRKDYQYLKPMITIDLDPFQWAALLSFSYNLGPGNADNLIQNINSENWEAFRDQFKLYINADGIPRDYLRDRREIELNYFFH